MDDFWFNRIFIDKICQMTSSEIKIYSNLIFSIIIKTLNHYLLDDSNNQGIQLVDMVENTYCTKIDYTFHLMKS